MDTTDILFICAGAFVGLDGIIARRTGRDQSRIGFGSGAPADGPANIFADVTPQDLRDFGLIPEFVGRLPVVSYVDPLDKDALKRILTEPKDSLVSQYTELLREDGVKLTFAPDALETAATLASETGTGARGLRSILEKAMRDVMFSAPKSAAKSGPLEIVVTREMILGTAKPVLRLSV